MLKFLLVLSLICFEVRAGKPSEEDATGPTLPAVKMYSVPNCRMKIPDTHLVGFMAALIEDAEPKYVTAELLEEKYIISSKSDFKEVYNWLRGLEQGNKDVKECTIFLKKLRSAAEFGHMRATGYQFHIYRLAADYYKGQPVLAERFKRLSDKSAEATIVAARDNRFNSETELIRKAYLAKKVVPSVTSGATRSPESKVELRSEEKGFPAVGFSETVSFLGGIVRWWGSTTPPSKGGYRLIPGKLKGE